MIQINLTLETGDTEFFLADLMKEMQDFLIKKDLEIVSCYKNKKKEKRDKDVE